MRTIYGHLSDTWSYKTIGDLIDDSLADIQTGPFGTMLHASSYVSTGTPVVAVQHIGDNRLLHNNHMPFIDSQDTVRLNRYSLREGDIVFGRKGAVDRRAFVTSKEAGWIQGSDCIRLRFLSSDIDPLFVSYLLGTRSYRDWIHQHAQGTTMASLNQEIIRRVPIVLPPTSIQKKIASILHSLDEKIELNHQMNQTLERLAMTLYKHWFVDFGPFQDGEFEEAEFGKLPKGWEWVNIKELVVSTMGGDWGSDTANETENCEAVVIRGADFEDIRSGIGSKAPKRFIKKQSFEKRSLKPGDIILENSVNAVTRCTGQSVQITDGLLKRLDSPVICASFCKVIRPKSKEYSILIYSFVKYLYLEGRMEHYQNVSANGIANFQMKRFMDSASIPLPTDIVEIDSILELLGSLLSTIYADTNHTLVTLRNYLLPRLLSGDIKVQAAEEQIEEALSHG